MLRGEVHNRGFAGRCEAYGEIFPCPTGLAIYESVKHELEQPAAPQIADGVRCPACGSVNIGGSDIRPAGWRAPRSCRDCHVTFDSAELRAQGG